MQHAPYSSNHSLHVVKQSSPAILRETSKGTSYYMVRLVFRPIYNCMTNDLHVSITIDFQLGFPRIRPSFAQFDIIRVLMYMRVLRRIPIDLQASYEFTMSSHVLGPVRSGQRTCTHVRLIGQCFNTGRNIMCYRQTRVMIALIHCALAVCLLVSEPCYQTVLCKVENIGNSG